jgi:hypothetical protein
MVWKHLKSVCIGGPIKALEAKVAQEGLILTEAQIVALEKTKQEKEAHGEIETYHPRYLGAQAAARTRIMWE